MFTLCEYCKQTSIRSLASTFVYIEDEVIPYIKAHKAIVRANNPRQAEKWVLMETFMPWFKDEVLKDSTMLIKKKDSTTSETLT